MGMLDPQALAQKVTIVMAPRERHYAVIPSLLSLFATVSEQIRVIVVQGDLPEDLAQQLHDLSRLRMFELIAPAYPLYPQEARNLGIAKCETEYVLITDNDMEYEAGWLEALVANADIHQADLVAPLIFIGPPRTKIIHHAGGRITTSIAADGTRRAEEDHQLENRNIDDVNPEDLGHYNEVVEFHCFLTRRKFLSRLGPLDERLITREQIDYALRARMLGATVTFEATARVTYMAKRQFTNLDLAYLSFRWNDTQALAAMGVVEDNWGISIDKAALMNNWIRAHRVRAYRTRYTIMAKSMPTNEFFHRFMAPQEHEALARAARLREGLPPPAIAERPGPADVEATLRSFLPANAWAGQAAGHGNHSPSLQASQ
ncbi:MAG: glycosyltransferase [Hyphomicrobiales bacterium]